jgi:hypothetical protein
MDYGVILHDFYSKIAFGLHIAWTNTILHALLAKLDEFL